MSEKPHPGPLGCGSFCRRVEKVAGNENTLRHRQSGAPLIAVLKESGSGDGTGGRRPDGGRPSGKDYVEKVAGTENTHYT